jgi:hypothetical protein
MQALTRVYSIGTLEEEVQRFSLEEEHGTYGTYATYALKDLSSSK